MGTWSEEVFGNDTACDWVGGFIDNPGLEVVEASIQNVLRTDGYVGSDEACECLAACEVIARLQGSWGLRDDNSKDLDEWIDANPMVVPDALKSAADSAITRILDMNSELREMWDQDGRNDEWHRVVDDLRGRVQG